MHSGNIPFRRLYVEELRALPRSPAALFGAAALLGVLLLCATITSLADSGGLDMFLFLACSVIPSLFGLLAAVPLASDRATRFAEPLFTLRLGRGTYFAVRLAVPLTLGLLYFVTLLPYLALTTMHIGVPDLAAPYLLAGFILLVASVAVGALFGVVFGDRSVGAATAATGGFLALGVVAMPLLQAVLTGADDAFSTAATTRLAQLSPHVLAREAAGLDLFVAAYDSPLRAGILAALFAIGLLGVSAWVFLRAQDVQGWRSERGMHRALLAVALVALVALPPLAAGGKERFDPVGDDDFPFKPANMTVALPDRGAPFGTQDAAKSPYDERELTFGQPMARDLVLHLPIPAATRVTDLEIALTGGGLVFSPARFSIPEMTQNESAPYRQGILVRLPVTVTPVEADWISQALHFAEAHVTYRADGKAHEETGTLLAVSSVPNARAHMLAAGAPLFLACIAGAIIRRARTS